MGEHVDVHGYARGKSQRDWNPSPRGKKVSDERRNDRGPSRAGEKVPDGGMRRRDAPEKLAEELAEPGWRFAYGKNTSQETAEGAGKGNTRR